MKKLLFMLMALSVSLILHNTAFGANVIVDGKAVVFDDLSGYPFIENGRTLVPLRASMEALGALVSWDEGNHTAIVRKDSVTVCCTIGENCIYRNGTRIDNDAAAIISNGRTYLPIRVVAEAFDASVDWDGNVNITSSGAGRLIYDIENSGLHVSKADLWKKWNEALELKSSGDYASAIEIIRQLAPDFLAENDGNSNAMLYKHLGECYGALSMNENASRCFLREAQFWTQMGKEQETIDAKRRSSLIKSSVQMYAKTENPSYMANKGYGANFEPETGLYIGAYAEGDGAVHEAYGNSKFYMDDFPSLAGKDMAGYILYMKDSIPPNHYDSHVKRAREKNKIMQIALEPESLSSITENDSRYIEFAKYMEESGVNFLVRFACEMNDETCPWHTEDYGLYIEKFRMVSNIFHTYAPNRTAVVWSPNFYPLNNIENYYPGDEYVDYVGISSYWNHQPETDPLAQGVDRSRWSSQLDTIIGLYAYKKPIIVSESGASYIDYNTYADITNESSFQINEFYTYLPIKYPAVKAAFIFDSVREGNYRFVLSENETYLNAYKSAITNPSYLSSQSEKCGFGYYELCTNGAVEAKTVEISSYIKTIKNDISYVVYRIYGEDVYTSYAIPYTAQIDFSAYSGKILPLSVIAFDSAGAIAAQKTYYVNIR